MSASVAVISFLVSSTITLQNTANRSLTLMPGGYIAFPQAGSHPNAYDIYEADAQGNAKQPSIGAAFLEVDLKGIVTIS